MKTRLQLLTLAIWGLLPFILLSEETYAFPHEDLPQYSHYGNTLRGIATKEMGAEQIEVWRSSLAVGSNTPRHVHETEEIFVLLKGKLLAVIGDKQIYCEAPATLICPAEIPHQLFNIGDEPTDQIVALGIDSKILDMHGKEMKLPWRNKN